MSGVLDNKKRVLDVILTELGRDQMNRGEFEVSFVTFSDKGSQYVDDGTGVASSILDNIYFETYSSPADEIIPEIDNEGDFLLTKKISPTLTVNNGILYEQTSSRYKQVDAFTNISSFTNITTGRWSGLQILRTESELPNFTIDRESFNLEFHFPLRHHPKTSTKHAQNGKMHCMKARGHQQPSVAPQPCKSDAPCRRAGSQTLPT